MMTTSPSGTADLGNAVWDLPPLILHPFADRGSSERLLENSRNVLLACGLAAGGETAQDDLNRRILEGRFAEIRMLFFLGKDVVRWTGQCQEFAGRVPELAKAGVVERSFARLLTEHMPEAVNLKLRGWGVHDAGVIFARAIGLNQIFAAPPEFHCLTEDFVRNYHRYADSFFTSWIQSAPFREVTSTNFRFDLYASGEYTKMLENEWGPG
jgi:hypothetical protein